MWPWSPCLSATWDSGKGAKFMWLQFKPCVFPKPRFGGDSFGHGHCLGLLLCIPHSGAIGFTATGRDKDAIPDMWPLM